MINWEIVIWIGVIVIFNPIFTFFLFVRRAKVNRKGKIILYSITSMIALFWCGLSTGNIVLSITAGILFAALLIYKNNLQTNIRQ